MCSADIFLGLLAILFPPLPVWVKRGICSADSVINILLCILGYVPGLLHAWYIIAKFPEADYEYGHEAHNERGERVYVFVHGDGHGRTQRGQPAKQQRMGYGTAGNNSNNAAGSSSGQAQQTSGVTNGEGSSAQGPAPPSYAAVVAGDNKVQTQD